MAIYALDAYDYYYILVQCCRFRQNIKYYFLRLPTSFGQFVLEKREKKLSVITKLLTLSCYSFAMVEQ